MSVINNLKKKNCIIPNIFTTKSLLKGNGNSKFISKELDYKKEVVNSANVTTPKLKATEESLSLSSDDAYKYSPYLKPVDIKGIKRADRTYDYNSSYSFMKAQKDYNNHLVKPNMFVKYMYNGMKTPLPPKKYKISEYVDVRLDMFAPFIITGIMSIPFFIFPCL